MSEPLPDVPPGFPPRPVGVSRQTEFTRLDDTGEVVGLLTVADADALAANLKPGQTAIEGHAPPGTYRKAGAWVAKPARPSEFHEWNRVTKAWADPRTLADFKAAKRSEMKAARDTKQSGGFTVAGSTFDSDAESRAAIQLNYASAVAAKADGAPFNVTWTLADDSDVPLSRAQMIAVGEGLQKMLDNAQTRYQARKAAIAAAPDAAAVAAITWS